MTGTFRRRKLPHWDVLDGTYFVTACLDGSIPAIWLRELNAYRRSLDERPVPDNLSEVEWDLHKQILAFAKLDSILDKASPIRHFSRDDLSTVVQQSIYHFAGIRYDLLAYVIMPSHLHWVFRPIPSWCNELSASVKSSSLQMTGKMPIPRTPREIIMHGMKSFTSNECNKLLNRRGTFWQAEAYDHWIRDEEELLRVIAYVENNPVKGGFCKLPEEFRYSSANDRKNWEIPVGLPLVPVG